MGAGTSVLTARVQFDGGNLGEIPLAVSAKAGHHAVVSLLLGQGADPNVCVERVRWVQGAG